MQEPSLSSAGSEVTRVQELVYELKIEQVMTKNVITVTPDCTIRDLKELMRVKRLSGVLCRRTRRVGRYYQPGELD